jgi:hypothetical protein
MGRAISPVTTLLAAVGLLSLSADALRYNATLDPYNVNKNQSKLPFLPLREMPRLMDSRRGRCTGLHHHTEILLQTVARQLESGSCRYKSSNRADK